MFQHDLRGPVARVIDNLEGTFSIFGCFLLWYFLTYYNVFPKLLQTANYMHGAIYVKKCENNVLC